MPRRPPKLCAKPGCSRRTRSKYCERHTQQAKALAWDGPKESAHVRGYGAHWRRTRRRILARDPFCRVCTRSPSTEVDHVVPRHLGGEDTDENLQGICDACHKQKSAREGHAAARPPDRAADKPPRNSGVR